MSKFWQVKNSVNNNAEILIYGAIASESSWLSDDTSPQAFADDLLSLNGRDVTVRINSGGGDVFAAHAISNQLIDYKGEVTVIIDGLAASAATIVAMAGDKIIMPKNAMMMIHNPMIYMGDYCTADELTSTANALDKIKGSIISAYQKRCNLKAEKLAELMDAETWLTADECVNYGFADEISGKLDPVLNNNILIVNKVEYDLDKFKNADKIKNRIESEETQNMTKLEAILNKLGMFDEITEPTNDANAVENAVKAERERVAGLDALKCDNVAVNAIVDVAKANGKGADDVKEYINAVLSAKSPAQKTVENMINDSNASGVNNIAAPTPPDDEVAGKSMDYMAQILNQLNGGKK